MDLWPSLDKQMQALQKRAREMDYSHEKIVEMATTWAMFNGFTADACGKCGKTANVLAGGPGWFCPCGHFIVLPFSGHFIPHERPDYGPPQARILAAIRQVRIAKGELVE